MGPVTGRSEGLRWPIDGIAFHPAGRLGTSNAAVGPVTLEFDSPEMLLILPRAELGRLSRALPAAARWPAPAT
jgi:thiamine pyrophosphokinase